ncbi:MAG: hypothetical protein JSR82_00430 [Verrucomicrobia bacterium]|nr:hypothetical protein [Verrucomicrobiota bacterium]
MKKIKRILAGLVLLAGISIILFIKSTPLEVTLIGEKDRLLSEVESLSAFEILVKASTSPSDSAIAAHISNKLVAKAAQTIVGTRIEHTGRTLFLDGLSAEVHQIHARSTPASLLANIVVLISARGYQVTVECEGSIRFEELQRNEKGTSLATFQINPTALRIVPQPGPFEFKRRLISFFAIREFQTVCAGSNLFSFAIPFETTFGFNIGGESQGSIPYNHGNGSLSYIAALPTSRVSYSFPALQMVPSSKGFWLLGGLSQLTSSRALTPLIHMPLARLTEVVSTLRTAAATSSLYASPPENDVTTYLGKKFLDEMARSFAAQTSASRSVSIRTTGRRGKIFENEWSDDLLGKGGYYLEPANDDGGSAKLNLGIGTFEWRDGVFLVDVTYTFSAGLPLHIHFDPLIGGGVGTTVRVEGSAAGRVALTARPALLGTGNSAVAAITFGVSCESTSLDIVTDGRASIGVGWASVPHVGIRVTQPIFRHPPRGVVLVDTRKTFVSLPNTTSGVDDSWRILLPYAAAVAQTKPKLFSADARSMVLAADVELTPIAKEMITATVSDIDAFNSNLATELLRILDEDAHSRPCNGEAVAEALIGPFRIGPKNDVVRLIVSIGRIVGAMTEEAKKILANPAKALADAPENLRREAERVSENIRREADAAKEQLRRQAEEVEANIRREAERVRAEAERLAAEADKKRRELEEAARRIIPVPLPRIRW